MFAINFRTLKGTGEAVLSFLGNILPTGEFWFFLSNWGKRKLLILIFCFYTKSAELSFE
jgi:hypothetical protein